jgi:hypothetical protein
VDENHREIGAYHRTCQRCHTAAMDWHSARCESSNQPIYM